MQHVQWESWTRWSNNLSESYNIKCIASIHKSVLWITCLLLTKEHYASLKDGTHLHSTASKERKIGRSPSIAQMKSNQYVLMQLSKSSISSAAVDWQLVGARKRCTHMLRGFGQNTVWVLRRDRQMDDSNASLYIVTHKFQTNLQFNCFWGWNMKEFITLT